MKGKIFFCDKHFKESMYQALESSGIRKGKITSWEGQSYYYQVSGGETVPTPAYCNFCRVVATYDIESIPEQLKS